MSDNRMTTPHEKHQTCGVCKHPMMSKTREHVKCNPLPTQRNAATNEG